MTHSDTKISKFLSLVLRHKPEAIGLDLDEKGWGALQELIEKAPMRLTRDDIFRVVRESDKQRFAISEDGLMIRANQGHSIEIDLGLEPVVPPDVLFHGTATRFLDAIRDNGLIRQNRQYVHLSPDRKTATKVGQRHGEPVILTVQAAVMHQAGHLFFVSDNGVWLTEKVPAAFIETPQE